MSIHWVAWALDREDVRGTPKLLLVGLADHAGEDGIAWPSVERLRRVAGLTARRHVFGALAALERAGLIVREDRPGRTTRYRLTAGGTCDDGVTGDGSVTRDGRVTPPVTLASPPPVTLASPTCDASVTQTITEPPVQPSPTPQTTTRARRSRARPDPPAGAAPAALWRAWSDVANAHAAPVRLVASPREQAVLDELGAAYRVEELRPAFERYWATPLPAGRSHGLLHFRARLNDLLAEARVPADVPPEDDWRRGFYHVWTCRECGEVHETDDRDVYQRRPCLKEHDTMSYAEWKARQPPQGLKEVV